MPKRTLRSLREQSTLSAEYVAAMLQISLSTLRNYEKGIQVPSIKTFFGFSHLYNIKPDDLFACLDLSKKS